MKFGHVKQLPPAEVLTRCDRICAHKTIVIVGAPRGGTSALAALLDAIGVPIVRSDNRPNFEHDNIVFNSFDKLPEVFRGFDEQYDVWGFKNPHIRHFSTSWFHEQLRNPHYILITKDVAGMSIRDHSDNRRSLSESLAYQAQQSGQVLSWFADLPPAPKMIVSYAKMLVYPEKAAHIAAMFCGLSPSREQIEFAASCLSPTGGYLTES